MPEKVTTENYIREFVMIFFIQKKVVAIVFSICFLLTCLIAFFWPPTYSSEAEVLVKHKKVMRSPETIEKVSVSEREVTESDVKAEADILTSINVIKKTVKSLQREGEFFKKNLSDKEFRALVSKIKKNLKTEITPKSDVFKVIFYWNDPIKAEKILRTHLREYLRYRVEIYSPTEAEVFFKKQVTNFENRLAKIEKELTDLAVKTSNPVPDEKIKTNLITLKSLEADLNKMLNNYVIKRNFIQYVEQELKSDEINCFSFIDNPNIGDFGKKLEDLLIEKEKLKRIYTDNSPPVRAITQQIRSTSKALRAEVKRYVEGEKAKLKAMKNAIQSIVDRIEKIKKENVRLYNTAIRSKALERQLRIAEESYETFLKRWNEAKIDRSTEASNIFAVSIISEAEANFTPVFPNKRKVIPIGFILSAIIGITAGFVVEFFDHTFKRPEDVERYTGLQMIFSIPKF